MAVLNRSQIPDVIDTRPLWISFLVWSQNKKSYTEIFRTKKESDAHVDIMEFSGLGRFALKPEGTPVTFDIPVQGVRRRVTHATYALGTAMTHEALEDAKFNVLDRQSEALQRSQLDHEERLAWSHIDDLYAGTTHTGIDGAAVITTAHTALKTGETLSNQVTPFLPVSIEALESATVIFLTQRSNEGHQIGNDLKGAMWATHTQNTHIVNTVLNTTGRPGTDLNDINTVTNMGIRPVLSPYRTSTSSWELMGAKGTDSKPGNGFVFNSREGYRLSNNVDADTGDRKWRGRYRASTMNTEWREVVGSTP